MNHTRSSVESCAAGIAGYLRANPQASDTADGIARWWLQAAPRDWPTVRAALQAMVQAGTLTSHRAGDGREHFRLAAAGSSTEPSSDPASP